MEQATLTKTRMATNFPPGKVYTILSELESALIL